MVFVYLLTSLDQVTDRLQALLREYIDLYLDEQNPRVQQAVLGAVRRLRRGDRLPATPSPLEEVMLDNEAASMSGQDISHIEQSHIASSSEGHTTPSTMTDASSPLHYNDLSMQYDVFQPEPYHGIARKVRLGSGSLYGDDAHHGAQDQDDDDDEFIDIDALSCVPDKRPTSPIGSVASMEANSFRSMCIVDLSQECTPNLAHIARPILDDDEHENDKEAFVDNDTICSVLGDAPLPSIEPVEPARLTSSRATSVVDLSDDYEINHDAGVNQASRTVSADIQDQDQREKADSALRMDDRSRADATEALPEGEIPPWDSPYASDYGFSAHDGEHAINEDPVESFSEDGDSLELGSIPDRPMTPEFLTGKNVDDPSTNDILASLNSQNNVSTPEQRSVRQVSPIVMPDAIGVTSETTVVNGMPTPLTGSFASGTDRQGLFDDNQGSPTPVARLADQSQRSSMQEPLRRSRYRRRRRISDSPDSQPATSPTRPIDLTDDGDETRGLPESPAEAMAETSMSPGPVTVEEADEEEPGSDMIHIRQRPIHSRMSLRRLPEGFHRLHNHNTEVDGDEVQDVVPFFPFLPPANLTADQDRLLTTCLGVYWRINHEMAQSLNQISYFRHNLQGLEERVMPIQRAFADRIGELNRENRQLRADTNENKEDIAELRGQIATLITVNMEYGKDQESGGRSPRVEEEER